MNNESIIEFFTSLGLKVETVKGQKDKQEYIVIRDYEIQTGSLKGKVCDIGILKTYSVPYVPPAAIHTRPHLVQQGQFNTHPSQIGEDWEYWSRTFRQPPTKPNEFLAQIATIFNEVRI